MPEGETERELCVMGCKILVVEDEIFVATEMENVIADMGHDPIGIAADQRTALKYAGRADVALVDLNLQDGPTGTSIGRILAQKHGVTVVFMTANPSQLGEGVPGTLGVLAKPVSDRELKQALDYAVAVHHSRTAPRPTRFQVFDFESVDA